MAGVQCPNCKGFLNSDKDRADHLKSCIPYSKGEIPQE